MTACVIYTRFSPRRNAEDSQSCETQETICREYARGKGWDVECCYRDEGISGGVIDRPGLEAALASLGRGDVLLVARRDRIARDVLLAELTRRRVAAAGAQIVAVDGDVAGDANDPTVVFVRQILDAVAELERKQIASRTKGAMLALQKAGMRIGRYAPYGSSVDPDDSSRLIPCARERRAVERIMQLAGEGMGEYAIARAMDAEMPGSARGNNWSVRTVRKIIARG